MKVVIVGGVAAGASAAARLRRLDEKAEIVLFERGPFISYANCGLPYHLGGEIAERDSLLVMPEAKFKAWIDVDVRSSTEVLSIDRKAKSVAYRDAKGKTGTESYDRLLLATGSSPLRPPMEGAADPRVHTLWSIPDMDGIAKEVDSGARSAVVVGAGAIGLETAENLAAKGLAVTIVELAPQILPTVDPEMTPPLVEELLGKGIALRLGRSVKGFGSVDGAFGARLDDGSFLPADFAVLSIGVRPNTALAKAAGLELGPRGHLVVDPSMRTSDPSIWAAGDAVEVLDPLTGGKTAIALAGPANKEGRIAADNMAGRSSRYEGTFGASVVKVGQLSAASVGMTERRLKQAGVAYRKLYLHPNSNAGYYPGGMRLDLKLLFAPDGKILGAQGVGGKGVDKRIDVIATAMRCGKTAPELASLELCYAPPFNSAKDPVNFAGFIAENILDGLSRPLYPDALPDGIQIVDARQPEEFELGSIPGAVNIPLPELRRRLGEIDRTRPVVTFCQVGLRGYLSERILVQNGFDAYNLSGGYLTWKLFQFKVPDGLPKKTPAPQPAPPAPAAKADVKTIVDARAIACPGPIIRLRKEIEKLAPGEALKILAPKTFLSDLKGWSAATGNPVLSVEQAASHVEAVVAKAGEGKPAQASVPTAPSPAADRASIVLFSNDLDKAMAALIIACGMAAQGTKVSIFFTFWGLSVLRKSPAPAVRKGFLARLFGSMLPTGAERLALSKMHMMGMGTAMMRKVMRDHHVTDVPGLLKEARELGVSFLACEMAMDVMGIAREELVDVDDVVGVASFVAGAKGGATLFI